MKKVFAVLAVLAGVAVFHHSPKPATLNNWRGVEVAGPSAPSPVPCPTDASDPDPWCICTGKNDPKCSVPPLTEPIGMPTNARKVSI